MYYFPLVIQQPLRGELARDLGQHMQDDHREDETNSQKENNQRVDSQALRLIGEQLQHGGRGAASTSSSGGQRLLVSLLSLFVGNVLSFSSRSQTAWGNSRRLDVSKTEPRKCLRVFISVVATEEIRRTILKLVIWCKYVFVGFST